MSQNLAVEAEDQSSFILLGEGGLIPSSRKSVDVYCDLSQLLTVVA
jgi:hypothetical protein